VTVPLQEALQVQLETLQAGEQIVLAEMIKRWRAQAAPKECFEALGLIREHLKAHEDGGGLMSDPETALAPSLVKDYGQAETIALPTEFLTLDAPLGSALFERCSDHNFGPGLLPLTTFSTLLHYSYGHKKFGRGYNMREFPFRMAPSAGGLQPIDLYVTANDVEGLRQGLYYFNPYGHTLKLVDEGNLRRRLVSTTIFQNWMAYAQVVLILVCNMPRVYWKYGDRGYRFAHVDAGVLAENLYLVGTALRLNTCAVAAYFDQKLNQLLEIDGRNEFAVLLFAVGHKPSCQPAT
jgi:SagB-type dehydrogenase family enzyme